MLPPQATSAFWPLPELGSDGQRKALMTELVTVVLMGVKAPVGYGPQLKFAAL